MKLSEKGYLKIGNAIAAWVEDGVIKVTFDPDKIEFEPDDFRDAVILTVEEAKAFWDDARDFYVHQSRISDDFEQLLSDIMERIEKVENM